MTRPAAVLFGLTAAEVSLVVAYAALTLAIRMLGCIVPTRRAMRVEPAEALRAGC